MPRLVLVKHSHPEIEPGIPANQWHLSAEGQRRCEELAERLTLFQVKRVYSSTEPKAAETARIVAARLGVPQEVVDNLHEHDRSDVTHLNSQKQFEDRVKMLFEKPDKLVFGNETGDQACLRFTQAVNSIVTKEDDQDIIIVVHGTVITLLVGKTNPIDNFLFWMHLGLPSIVVLSLPSKEIISVVENLST